MARFEDAIGVVLAHEGGFVDDPVDTGGATNFGVSLRYLRTVGDTDGDGWLEGDLDHDGDVDADDIRQLTVEDAKTIYRRQWWDRYGYDRIEDQALATKVFDLAVNMGPRRAHMLLQEGLRTLGNPFLAVDGALGPNSMAAINKAVPARALFNLRGEAVQFYRDLIRRKPQYEKYRRGWERRARA